MRLLPGLRPGPRWGLTAPPTPSWERLCIPKKVSLIFLFPNDMPGKCVFFGNAFSSEMHSSEMLFFSEMYFLRKCVFFGNVFKCRLVPIYSLQLSLDLNIGRNINDCSYFAISRIIMFDYLLSFHFVVE